MYKLEKVMYKNMKYILCIMIKYKLSNKNLVLKNINISSDEIY